MGLEIQVARYKNKIMTTENQTILVTGGAGFIGSHLCDRLLELGHRVICVDNLNHYYSPKIKIRNIQHNFNSPDFVFVFLDITKKDQLDKLFREEKIDKIVHLAARAGVRPSIEKPLWYKEANVTGTVNLLELAKQYRIKNFIFGSSSSVYGNSTDIPFKETQNVDYPISPYAASKKACELFCYTYSYLCALNVTCLRFFTVYGPRNRPDGMAMYQFIERISNGVPIKKFGDGTTKRAYTYIGDIVDGIVLALDKEFKFEIINLGGAEMITLNDLINIIEEIVGKKAFINQLEIPKGDVLMTYADNSKAEELLGFKPKVDVKTGVKKMWEWYQKKDEIKTVVLPEAKKVLIYSVAYFPFVGGAEVAIKEITDRLDYYEFHLVTTRFDKKLPKEEKIGNVTVYRVGWGTKFDKYLYFILALRKGLKLYKENKFEVVHGVLESYAGLSAMLFKMFTGVKYLLTMQSGDSEEFMRKRTWFWYPIYKRVFKNADFIQTISQYLANRARKYGYRGLVKVIPNGVDLSGFNKDLSNNEKENLKKDLGINENEKILITTSRLVEKNAIDDLIKAAKYLDFPFKLLILGRGYQEEKLKQLAKDLGLEDKVIFLGFVEYHKISQYLKIADVFIRPSLSEGLGNSFLEAMLCQVPVVATPVGGIPDFLIDEQTGLFCEVKNPESIADKIKKLINDDNLRKNIITNAYDMVLRDYDWEGISEEMREIYLNL
jgi:UDP-glucuronate 4-epimerase